MDKHVASAALLLFTFRGSQYSFFFLSHAVGLSLLRLFPVRRMFLREDFGQNQLSVYHTRGTQLMFRLGSLGVLALSISLTGCGSDVVEPTVGVVSGVVTLDGVPVADATVRFRAVEGGRPSIAITGADGSYKPTFKGDKNGVLLGMNEVIITTGQEENGKPGEEGYSAAIKEIIPAKYHQGNKSELKVDVKAGENTFNLELTSS